MASRPRSSPPSRRSLETDPTAGVGVSEPPPRPPAADWQVRRDGGRVVLRFSTDTVTDGMRRAYALSAAPSVAVRNLTVRYVVVDGRLRRVTRYERSVSYESDRRRVVEDRTESWTTRRFDYGVDVRRPGPVGRSLPGLVWDLASY